MRRHYYFPSLQNPNLVMVLQLFNVKLIDGLAGICLPFLPQYLTNAILLGALH